jgi:hypothetical protein
MMQREGDESGANDGNIRFFILVTEKKASSLQL